MIRKLAHINFTTINLNRMIDFYTNALGLPIKFKFTSAEGETFGCYFDCGDSTFIEVFDRDLKVKQWGGSTDELTSGNQYGHFCLEVTNLEHLREALLSKEIKVTEIRRGFDQSLQMWTADPDGNKIELMQYTTASWQLLR